MSYDMTAYLEDGSRFWAFFVVGFHVRHNNLTGVKWVTQNRFYQKIKKAEIRALFHGPSIALSIENNKILVNLYLKEVSW